jgi:choice-of-anchor B domain-containing protein
MRIARATLGTLVVLLAAAGAASGQGDRVHLLSRFNGRDGGGSGGWDYNDVLGYRAPDGREVALLGCWSGTSFVETTDPFNPVELAFVTHSGSLWSDMSVWQDYVYVVTDQSAGGGLQIIDVSDLSNIHVVGNYIGFNTAHSIFVDQTAGIIYCCGTNVGLVILDLANPTAPTLVTTYTSQYVHEVTAQNGVAHFSEIYAGIYRTVDVSALPTLTTLDTVTTPAAFAHSSTVDENDAVVGLTDEVNGAKFVLYDVSDPTNITKRGTFIENPDGILHNVLVSNGIAQLSAYAEGYVALDVTDPAHPIRLGGYDTWPGASGNFNAAWGIWQQPSGTIYISNIEDGLWVLSRATRIAHAPLADTLDETGPYVVVATITPSSAGGGVTSATLEWTADEGATTTQVALAPTGNPDEWSAPIPGQRHGTTVKYRLTATDALGTSVEPVVADGRFVFGVGERTSRYAESFDGATDGGWTHGKSSGIDDWARGIPARRQMDPYRTTSGVACFGNDLGNGGDGLYPNSSNEWLESPAIDLSAARRTRLRFSRWLRVDDSANDVARVLVNGTEIWRNPTNGGTLPTLDNEWATLDFDVAALADGVAATKVRFELQTNGSVQFGGWNVDDVELYSVSSRRDPEDYGTGTAGTGGIVPVLSTVGDPTLGSLAFEVDGAQIRGAAGCLLAIGVARNDYVVKGIRLLVDLAPPAVLVPVVASGTPGSAGTGAFALFFEIDDDPALDGLEVDLQILVADPDGPKNLAASQGRAVWLSQ